MIFWKKKLNSEEYDSLRAEARQLLQTVERLDTKVQLLQTDLANLRGQFNRKLSGLSKEIKEEEKVGPKEEEKAKALNSPGPVVFTGMHGLDFPK